MPVSSEFGTRWRCTGPCHPDSPAAGPALSEGRAPPSAGGCPAAARRPHGVLGKVPLRHDDLVAEDRDPSGGGGGRPRLRGRDPTRDTRGSARRRGRARPAVLGGTGDAAASAGVPAVVPTGGGDVREAFPRVPAPAGRGPFPPLRRGPPPPGASGVGTPTHAARLPPAVDRLPGREAKAWHPPRLRVVGASDEINARGEAFCRGQPVGAVVVEAECELLSLVASCAPTSGNRRR